MEGLNGNEGAQGRRGGKDKGSGEEGEALHATCMSAP